MQDTDDRDQVPSHPPAFWLEELAESDRQLAAGETVPLEPLLAGLDRSADELERSLSELTSVPPKR